MDMSKKLELPQFRLSRIAKEINNPMRNWSVGYMAEVMLEFAKDYHEKEKRQLIIDFKNWEVENDVKNLKPEQLAEFYIQESTLCSERVDVDFCKKENGCLKDEGFEQV